MHTRHLFSACLILSLLAVPAFAWLRPGNPAPDITVITDAGIKLRLSELYAAGNTLVYFFPQAGSPDCTTEACNLRDNFEALGKLDVTIIGVSHDSREAQKVFKEKNQLPFSLVSDQDGAVSKAFFVPNLGGTNQAKRQSFIINQAGIVVWCDYKSSAKTMAQDALRAIARVRSSQGNIPLDKLRAESYKDQDERTSVDYQRARGAEPYAGPPADNPANKPKG